MILCVVLHICMIVEGLSQGGRGCKTGTPKPGRLWIFLKPSTRMGTSQWFATQTAHGNRPCSRQTRVHMTCFPRSWRCNGPFWAACLFLLMEWSHKIRFVLGFRGNGPIKKSRPHDVRRTCKPLASEAFQARFLA